MTVDGRRNQELVRLLTFGMGLGIALVFLKTSWSSFPPSVLRLCLWLPQPPPAPTPTHTPCFSRAALHRVLPCSVLVPLPFLGLVLRRRPQRRCWPRPPAPCPAPQHTQAGVEWRFLKTVTCGSVQPPGLSLKLAPWVRKAAPGRRALTIAWVSSNTNCRVSISKPTPGYPQA